MRAALLLAVSAAGCATGPRFGPAGIPSAARTAVQQTAWPALEKAVRAQGFEPSLVGTTADTRGMAAAAEEWDEAADTATFTATKGGDPARLTTAEMAAVLQSLKSDIRRRIQAVPDAEVIDWAEAEGFQERTLTGTYRVGRVFGTAIFKLSPASGKAEETGHRLDVTVREQPVP